MARYSILNIDSIAFTYGLHTFQCWKRLAFGATKSYADGETVVNLNQSFDAGGKPCVKLPNQKEAKEDMTVTVLAFNFFGDGLRDAADPYK